MIITNNSYHHGYHHGFISCTDNSHNENGLRNYGYRLIVNCTAINCDNVSYACACVYTYEVHGQMVNDDDE